MFYLNHGNLSGNKLSCPVKPGECTRLKPLKLDSVIALLLLYIYIFFNMFCGDSQLQMVYVGKAV